MMNKFLILLFLLLPLGSLFSITLPYSKYFPLKPGFHFNLISANSNTIDVRTKIEIPQKAQDVNYVFSIWDMDWQRKGLQIHYRFRFRVSQYGEFYLISMSDGVYNRLFQDKIRLFSNGFQYGKEIPVGKNISFRYIKSFSMLSVGKLRIKNVVKAELKLYNQNIFIYIAPFKGIIAIKAPHEKYLMVQK